MHQNRLILFVQALNRWCKCRTRIHEGFLKCFGHLEARDIVIATHNYRISFAVILLGNHISRKLIHLIKLSLPTFEAEIVNRRASVSWFPNCRSQMCVENVHVFARLARNFNLCIEAAS